MQTATSSAPYPTLWLSSLCVRVISPWCCDMGKEREHPTNVNMTNNVTHKSLKLRIFLLRFRFKKM